MTSRAITYIWKIPKPQNEGMARALMAAAYTTAMQTDPNCTQILIRSRIHCSTMTGNWSRPDQPHITIAVKNPQTQQNEAHQASHGYTESMESTQVVRVQPSNYVKPDSVKNTWPQGLQQQEIQGNPAELGHGFITWASLEQNQ